MKPTKLPLWADNPSDPNRIVEPPATKLDEGWLPNEKPPAEWQNWWQNNVQQWVEWFDTTIEAWPTVRPTDPTSLSVDLLAGSVIVNRKLIDVAAATIDMTSYVSALAAGESALAVVLVDDSGGVLVVPGAPSTGTPELPSEVNGAFLFKQVPIAVVRLTAGMTTIERPDVYGPPLMRDRRTGNYTGDNLPFSNERNVVGAPGQPLMLQSGETYIGVDVPDQLLLGRKFLLGQHDYRFLSLNPSSSGQIWWRIGRIFSSPSVATGSAGGGRLIVGSADPDTARGQYVFEVASSDNDNIAITMLSGPLNATSGIIGARISKDSGGPEAWIDILVDHPTVAAGGVYVIADQWPFIGGQSVALYDSAIESPAVGAIAATLTDLNVSSFATAGNQGGISGSARFDPTVNGGQWFTGTRGGHTALHGFGGGMELTNIPGTAITTTDTAIAITSSGLLPVSGDYLVTAVVDLLSVSAPNQWFTCYINKFAGAGSVDPSIVHSAQLNGNNENATITTVNLVSGADSTTRLELRARAQANGKYEVDDVTWHVWRIR